MNIIDKFLSYPLFIQVASIVIAFSFSILLGTISFIVIKRLVDAALLKRTRKVKRLVTDELTQGIMLEDTFKEKSFTKILGRLQRIAKKSKLYTQVIADELIYYHKNLTDTTARLLYRLYSRLHLTDKALENLKASKWNIKAKALREMQEMPPAKENLSYITPLLNSTNNDLRIEAQAAYLKLAKTHPFMFLDDANFEILDWHQIILLDVINNDPDLEIPFFRKWLDSPNPTVITFCIKLILDFQQFDAIPELIKLIEHPNEKVKKDAIAALGKLYANEAEEMLVNQYEKEELSIKKYIIEAIGKIASGKYLQFLREQFLTVDDFSLTKSVGCALANHPTFNKETFFVNEPLLTPQRVTIFNHCTNTLIRN
ncbi:MAG: HEAT repeat domain-containing protein [Chitinophagaceae bacterium]|nr:MAG: HEAT repeat domain-containing protein [Chitinophagaceae bacterium]